MSLFLVVARPWSAFYWQYVWLSLAYLFVKFWQCLATWVHNLGYKIVCQIWWWQSYLWMAFSYGQRQILFVLAAPSNAQQHVRIWRIERRIQLVSGLTSPRPARNIVYVTTYKLITDCCGPACTSDACHTLPRSAEMSNAMSSVVLPAVHFAFAMLHMWCASEFSLLHDQASHLTCFHVRLQTDIWCLSDSCFTLWY